MLEKIVALMAEIFQVNAEEISADTQFGDFPQWDSMGHMDLMVALESQYGVEISADNIRDLVSVQKILEVVESRQNG